MYNRSPFLPQGFTGTIWDDASENTLSEFCSALQKYKGTRETQLAIISKKIHIIEERTS